MPSLPPATLPDLLGRGGSQHAAVAVPRGPSVTYGELSERVEQLARLLRGAGIEAGDTVSLVLGNDLSFIECFLALTCTGAVAAPLNPAYTADEFKSFMEAASAKTVVLPVGAGTAHGAASGLGLSVISVEPGSKGLELRRDGKLVERGASVAKVDAAEPALFLHTSGTTSRPKGVPLTHANIVASTRNIVGTYALTDRDVALVVMPLFHVHGLIGVVLSTLASGGTVVVPPRFSAGAFWGDAKAHAATWYSAVPTIHQILVARADQDNAPKGTFRFIRSCSSALAPALFEQMEARFASPVLEAYGMTEAAHQMASNPLPPDERRAGTVGVGTGVEVGVMDEGGALLPQGGVGEVVIRGPNVMSGYRDNPQANAASFTHGWFRTGDQGTIERGGYLRLTGRLKELINRGGEKISPLEVDAVLARHPAIAEAICFGVPDAKYGEEIQAAVVLKRAATEQDIQRFCGEHLVDFKVPKRVHVVDALPRTATGKIQRKSLSAMFAGK
ncbi:MAG: AMP-binding protein [Chloroflexi bacterium]|nr:AMP-binding protein [Chloroflexota bacterium]